MFSKSTWLTGLGLASALSFVASDARAETIVLTGDYGYQQYRPASGELAGDTVDAYAATWIVQNSANDDPTPGMDCEIGPNMLNRYPILIEGSDGVAFQGGRIISEIPQASAWAPTYCNSAAFMVRESSNARVENLRVEGAWDAIRFSVDSVDFTIKSVWVSNFRDDGIENDQVRSGRIEDSLFDGGFQGLSLDPGGSGGPSDVDDHRMVLDHFIQRLQPYPFDGNGGLVSSHGTLFKGTSYAPRMEIVHSVFAAEVDSFAGDGRLTSVLDKLDHCENNYFLWLGDGPVPTSYTDHLPSCFAIREGDEAKSLWEELRTNWIDCHPDVPRSAADPASDPAACDPLFIDNGLMKTPDDGTGTWTGTSGTGTGTGTSGTGTGTGTSDTEGDDGSSGATDDATTDETTTGGSGGATGASSATGSAGTTTGAGAEDQDSGSGCGCTTSRPPGVLGIATVLLPLGMRRRRPD